ncbi:30S ribosomal protein S11 [Chloracidobacterium validum]|uniref:Small ribosomal subunit protein uS11 n=1 Tax=Chloracidobacterium validum TaxID=2821543 RepID=A0ABX8BCX3_9BACT|nr:30S ribosomal protein S11 [Chloracidobacterium validum]QUW03493.1 30S ribosomal protein S11 [Chloracidobacterium validum]
MAKKNSQSKPSLKKKTFKKKEKKNIPQGIVHIQASFNNTLVSITDLNGNLLAASSSGALGFKGSRKGTPFAAQQAAAKATAVAKESGLQSCEVRISGPGSGRESAIRAIQANGVEVRLIRDVTPIPHNGCRPRKKRRV